MPEPVILMLLIVMLILGYIWFFISSMKKQSRYEEDFWKSFFDHFEKDERC